MALQNQLQSIAHKVPCDFAPPAPDNGSHSLILTTIIHHQVTTMETTEDVDEIEKMLTSLSL